jgi:hypothetical protein
MFVLRKKKMSRKKGDVSKRLRIGGRFISKEKQETIEFLATQNGLKKEDAQTFLNQNLDDVEGYLIRGEVEATFSSDNYEKYLTRNFNKFYVNGEKVSRERMIYLVMLTQKGLLQNTGSYMNLFHGVMTDINSNGAQTLKINLPVSMEIVNGKKVFSFDEKQISEMEENGDIEIKYKQFGN